MIETLNCRRGRFGSRRNGSAGLVIAACGLAAMIAAGCQQEKVDEPAAVSGPDYSRQLPPGQSALRRVTDPDRMPDMAAAWNDRNVYVLESIDRSKSWFRAPSSKQFFPFEGVTHEQAHASLYAFEQVLNSATSAGEFVDRMQEKFDIYESVGYNDEGIVLFTGYYAPIFPASLERTSRFTAPLYKRPDDLVTDEVTGEPQGRKTSDGDIVPYYTRREIDESRMFAGNELVWVENDLAAYIIHVNGSAKLQLDTGETMYIGYAGKTDRPYHGLGRSMVDEGLLSPNELSLAAIRRAYRDDPQPVRELMYRNENYVFFTEYAGESWPSGSLGVPVTPEASLATDKRIYPRGGVVMVDTEAVTFTRGHRPFTRFMLDQDTGGAINAPGRADIFMGIGPAAEILAGGQYAEGRLYYFFVKEDLVDDYLPADIARQE